MVSVEEKHLPDTRGALEHRDHDCSVGSHVVSVPVSFVPLSTHVPAFARITTVLGSELFVYLSFSMCARTFHRTNVSST